MSSFLADYTCSNKLIIDHKIRLIQKLLKDLTELIVDNPDDDYSREYTVVSNTLLSFENIRLFKLIHKN